MNVVTRIVFEAPAEEEAKAFERGLKKGLRAAAVFWHKDFAKGHFRPGAVGKYQYRRRSGKYLKEKKNKFSHQDPLTWTGQSRSMILGTSVKGRVRKFKSGGFVGSITFKAPKYFFQFQKGRPEQSKVAELIRTTTGEFVDLRQIVDDSILVELKKKRRKRKVLKT